MVGVGAKSSNKDVNSCGITRLIIATLKVVTPLLFIDVWEIMGYGNCN
jgi:hypothetical protein